MKIIRIIILTFVLLPYNQFSQSLNGKKVIYVYGGMDGHWPKESVAFFVPLLEKEGAIVKVFNNFSVYEDEQLMKETDLIIQVLLTLTHLIPE